MKRSDSEVGKDSRDNFNRLRTMNADKRVRAQRLSDDEAWENLCKCVSKSGKIPDIYPKAQGVVQMDSLLRSI